jgi:two-component system, OmpR family, sensor kinase
MRLRRPPRPQLRTRVLAGVLLVTLLALAAFDIAAVTGLRHYLLGQTDSQLEAVARLYRLMTPRVAAAPISGQSAAAGSGQAVLPPASIRARTQWVIKPPPDQVIAGPHFRVNVPIFQPFSVTLWPGAGLKPSRGFVIGNPGLLPQPQRLAGLRALGTGPKTVSPKTVTAASGNGQDQLRLLAVPEPGGSTLVVTTSLDKVNKTIGQLELILAIGSAVAGLLAAAGVAWIMRRGLRPIETMAAQADEITAGDLADRVTTYDPRTEVGRLGTAINGMLARIEDFMAEREASQEATRQFFADASHELRTPLASLRANAELYQQGALPDRGQVDEAMRRITLESQRMSGLVDDMLRLARLDQQPGHEHEPVDLTALVTECAQRARTNDPGRTWHTHIAGGLEATGDEELLRRAIDNLLANVHAHTPDDAVATITAARWNGSVSIEISDNGPGVPAGQLPHIFERFYRAAAPSHRPGSGLGLAIVTAIATAHNGTAEAALNDPHGLRITLTVPACSQHDPAEPPAARVHAVTYADTGSSA